MRLGAEYFSGVVDEADTEAAVTTVVVMKEISAPAEPKQVTIDRPFIFLIRGIKTGTILFVRRVMDPGSQIRFCVLCLNL